VTASFTGKSCALILRDGANDYNLTVDGKPRKVLVTQKSLERYGIGGLSKGRHVLTLSKRTEGNYGAAVFGGLVLEEGERILPPPSSPSRRLEFIGDSISCGYGVEGPGVKCASLRPYENVDQAYERVVARRLKAECHVTAYSGKGVVRNYGDKRSASTNPMPALWERALVGEPYSKWDFNRYQPDLLVILLGSNDFSTDPHPEHGAFVEGYLNLLKSARSHYPRSAILCLVRPNIPQLAAWEREAVQKFSMAGGSKIHVSEMMTAVTEDLGCDWHPNVKAHKRLADKLEPVIRKIMRW